MIYTSVPSSLPLSGFKIVEFSHRLSGPYCGMLLADLGADVVKIEPPAGDPMRRKGRGEGSYGAAYAALNRGKRTIRLDVKSDAGRAAMNDLLAGADAFISNFRPRSLLALNLDPVHLTERFPGLVACSLSAAGWDDVGRDIGFDDGAAQAASGLMYATGWPGDGPVLCPIPIAALASALYGAIAVTAGLSSGNGAAVDCAMIDCIAACLEFPLMHAATLGEAPARNGGRHPTGSPSQPFAAGQGVLSIMATSPGEFERLTKALGRSELAVDPRFSDNDSRLENRNALEAEIERLLASDSAANWFERLSEAGVACAPLQSIEEMLVHPLISARKIVRPLRFEDEACQIIALPGGRVQGGESDAVAPCEVMPVDLGWGSRRQPASHKAPSDVISRSPSTLLSEVRVVDLTRYLSGPFATAILADLGADVVKIEAPGGDPARRFRPRVDQQGGYFASINRGKRSLVLDLKAEKDLARLKELIRQADIVIENFRPGVMDRLGLSNAELYRLNPDLVAISISGYGEDGPLSKRAAYDMTIQAFSGLAHQTGYAESGPTRMGISLGDIGTGLFAALAATAGLARRSSSRDKVNRTEIPMIDSILALMEPLVVARSVGAAVEPRLGGHHHAGTPMGAFPAADGHVYFAAASDENFIRLSKALGAADWLADPRFSSRAMRSANQTALIEAIEARTRAFSAADLIAALERVGLTAAIVNSVTAAVDSELFRRRSIMVNSGPFRVVRSPITGIDDDPKTSIPGAPDLDDAAGKAIWRNRTNTQAHA